MSATNVLPINLPQQIQRRLASGAIVVQFLGPIRVVAIRSGALGALEDFRVGISQLDSDISFKLVLEADSLG